MRSFQPGQTLLLHYPWLQYARIKTVKINTLTNSQLIGYEFLIYLERVFPGVSSGKSDLFLRRDPGDKFASREEAVRRASFICDTWITNLEFLLLTLGFHLGLSRNQLSGAGYRSRNAGSTWANLQRKVRVPVSIIADRIPAIAPFRREIAWASIEKQPSRQHLWSTTTN